LPLTDRQNAASSWSPILPLIIGDENAAVALADSLRERGFFIPAIRYPTVARGSARLRMTITADHTAQDIDQLASAFQAIANHES
jgi:8-amino-7-oxononanoate synthase